MGAKKPSKPDTKELILDAALETVQREGIVGASARAIAKTGDFNQALVFYHFGSVEDLMLAALERAHGRRVARLGDQLNAVEDLAGLVAVATQLHGRPEEADTHALAAIVAGWPTTSGVGARVLEIIEPWNEMVQGAIERAIAESPLRSLIPAADAAYMISALFLGIEMLSRLDSSDERAKQTFASLQSFAALAQPFLTAPKTAK